MHRLRDLRSTGRWAALLVAVALAVPFGAAIAQADDAGFTVSGDNGIIALKAFDVLDGTLPTIGLPSTAGLYSENNPHHPGPIEFYALALPMQLLGPSMGMVVWTAFANGASILVAAWVVFRRAGAAVGLWGAVVFGLIAWSEGPAQLVDPVSSNAGGIPMVALAVLAWAVATGDRRLFPLFALWSAYVAQQHLGVLGFGLALSVLGLIGFFQFHLRSRAEALSASEAEEPVRDRALDDADLLADPWSVSAGWSTFRRERGLVRVGRDGGTTRWVLGGLAVALVAWAPVIVDLVTGRPSNVAKIAGYASDQENLTVGLSGGFRQVVRALGLPPLITRTDLSGEDLVASVSPVTMAVGVLVACALVAIGVHGWNRRPLQSRLALITVSLAMIGLLIGSQVPDFELTRLNLYRWTFVVSALTWLLIGWLVIERLSTWPRAERLRTAPHPALAFGAVLVVMAVAAGSVTVAGPQEHRDEAVFALETEMNAAVLDAVEGYDNVLIIPQGAMAVRSLTQSLAVALEADGHRAVVPAYEVPSYGTNRAFPDVRPDVAIVIRSAAGPVSDADLDATEIIELGLNGDEVALVEEFARQLTAGPVVLSPDADAIAEEAGVNALQASVTYEAAASRARSIAYQPDLLALLEDGYVEQPTVDPDLVERIQAADLQTLWSEDSVRVLMMTPGGAYYQYPFLDDENPGADS